MHLGLPGARYARGRTSLRTLRARTGASSLTRARTCRLPRLPREGPGASLRELARLLMEVKLSARMATATGLPPLSRNSCQTLSTRARLAPASNRNAEAHPRDRDVCGVARRSIGPVGSVDKRERRRPAHGGPAPLRRSPLCREGGQDDPPRRLPSPHLPVPRWLLVSPYGISGQTKRTPVSLNEVACATTSCAFVSWLVMPNACTTRQRPPL